MDIEFFVWDICARSSPLRGRQPRASSAFRDVYWTGSARSSPCRFVRAMFRPRSEAQYILGLANSCHTRIRRNRTASRQQRLHVGPLWEGSLRLRLRHCSSPFTTVARSGRSQWNLASASPPVSQLTVARSRCVSAPCYSAAQCRGTVARSRSRPSGALPKGPVN